MSGPGVDRGASEKRHLLGLGGFTLAIAAGLSLAAPGFASLDNLQSMATQLPEFGLLSLAVLPTMLSGGIDLSVVATANLASIVAALLLTTPGVPGWSAVLAAIGVGAVCGILNGILVAICRFPAILATLGTLQLISGLAIVLTRGHAVTGLPDWISDLGDAAVGGVPVPLIAFAVIAAVLACGLRLTRFGFELRMAGTNALAARYAGLRLRALILRTYVLAGVVAALAGLVILVRVNSADASYGGSYLLLVILINILAGVDPRGGFGSVPGVVLAVVALQLLASGLDFLSLNNFARDLLFGGLLILVMAAKGIPGPRLRAMMRLARWKPG
jgi:simple sugar transport system permease protein